MKLELVRILIPKIIKKTILFHPGIMVEYIQDGANITIYTLPYIQYISICMLKY